MLERSDIIEAMAVGMYGDKWYSTDPKYAPTDKLKDIWRDLAKRALSGLETVATITTEETK